METRPIIFNQFMVQAILKGHKTQTRRVAKCKFEIEEDKNDPTYFKFQDEYGDGHDLIELAKYQVGDILYVRETFSPYANNTYVYKADYENINDKKWQAKWKPSIFMPKLAARLFLRITNVRVERLQDISDEDCLLEGIQIFLKDEDSEDPYWEVPAYWKDPEGKIVKTLLVDDFYSAFFNLWDSINYKRGYGWETNPIVFVYDFEVKK